MRSPTWHVHEALLLLMSGGFFVHLISASRHLADDSSRVAGILLRPVDGALFVLMLYCAAVLIARPRPFARTFDLRSRARRVGYWAITAYVTVSLAGHVLFLLTGDTRFFDGFPWWFSLAIIPVYGLVVAYVVTLRPHPGTSTTAVATDAAGVTRPTQQPVGATALPARS